MVSLCWLGIMSLSGPELCPLLNPSCLSLAQYHVPCSVNIGAFPGSTSCLPLLARYYVCSWLHIVSPAGSVKVFFVGSVSCAFLVLCCVSPDSILHPLLALFRSIHRYTYLHVLLRFSEYRSEAAIRNVVLVTAHFSW